MNTVFKLYLQVWILWALAAAACAGLVWRAAAADAARGGRRPGASRSSCSSPSRPSTRFSRRGRRSTTASITTAGRTLDGAAFMERAVHTENGVEMPLGYDHEAIAWMQQNVDGSPVVPRRTRRRRCTAGAAGTRSYTGNPSIVGWDYHQRQQRPAQSEQVQARVADVQSAYRTADPALAPTRSSRATARRMSSSAHSSARTSRRARRSGRRASGRLDVAYRNPGVPIYRVTSAG